jgi:CRP-like cAMP-binding protein
MISTHELRKMNLLKDMPEGMLSEIAEVAQVQIFSADSVLFRQNERLEHFYMVLSGQVSLSMELVPDVTIILGTIRPGYSCGISTFIPGALSSATAACDETCELICLSGERMSALFEQDWDLAFHFTFRLVRMFKSIMDHRSEIFKKFVQNHPELQSSYSDLEHLAPIF